MELCQPLLESSGQVLGKGGEAGSRGRWGEMHGPQSTARDAQIRRHNIASAHSYVRGLAVLIPPEVCPGEWTRQIRSRDEGTDVDYLAGCEASAPLPFLSSSVGQKPFHPRGCLLL
jgi:hypothetical protein